MSQRPTFQPNGHSTAGAGGDRPPSADPRGVSTVEGAPGQDPKPPEGMELPLALQQALSSLDVDLDAELTRYRRHVPGSVVRARQHARAYAAMMAGTAPAAASGAIAASPAVPSAPPPPAPPPPPPAPPASSLGAAERGALRPEPEAVSAPAHEWPTDEAAAPDRYLESSAELLRSLDEIDPLPLDAAPAEPPKRKGGMATLLTPLGIGSLLLLVLSSATLGYLVVNPSVLSRLGSSSVTDASGSVDGEGSGRPDGIAPNLANSEFDPLDLNSLSTIPPNRQGLPEVEVEGQPDGVTEDESSLGASQITELPATPAGTPAAAPSTPAPSAPQAAPAAPAPARSTPSRPSTPRPAPSRSTPAPQPQPSSSSTPTAAAPAASSSSSSTRSPSSSRPAAESATAPSASVASTASSQQGYVYVVTPYTGDRSLEQAQQAVSGAYVRNFPGGAQVQMGAFSSPEGARDLVQELNNQGIPAQIYD